MAAATVNSRENALFGVPYLVRKIQLSALTAGQLENLAHGGPTGAKVSHVLFNVSTKATSGHVVDCRHEAGSDSLTNDTVALRFDVEVGGDITGAVVDCFIHFVEQASGGIVV